MSQSSHPTLFFSALMVAGLALIPGLSLRAQGEYLDALGGDPYQNFIQQEGIPNYTDVYIKNVWTLPVAPWARTGVLGAYINLANAKMPNESFGKSAALVFLIRRSLTIESLGWISKITNRES